VTYAADDVSIQDSEQTELFEFTYPGGVTRYAGGSEDITVDANGDAVAETYYATAAAAGRLVVAQVTELSELSIELAGDDPVVQLYSTGIIAGYGPPIRGLEVRVFRYEKVSGETIQMWRGYAGGLAFKGPKASYRISSAVDDALTTQIPDVVLQRQCNAHFTDSRCGIVATSVQTAATISSISTDGLQIIVSAIGGASPYHVGGTVVHVGSTEVRGIRDQNGTTLDLALIPFRNAQVGDAVLVRAGCDYKAKTCRDKFNNIPNFRGHPIAQLSNPFVLGVTNNGRRTS